MNRSLHRVKHASSAISFKELSKKTAFHEAGHAAAIYLGNKEKQLPEVFFQLFINHDSQPVNSPHLPNYLDSCAKIEGGRLIHTLPHSLEDSTQQFSAAQKQAYQQAFEADIINLLVGPLAEANYVALRDGETINPRLVNLNALHHYGGSSDLAIVNDYMRCFIGHAAQREKKLFELFLAAFDFINDLSHWYAITVLADYILANNNDVIDCKDIIAVLNDPFFIAKKNIWF